MLMRRRSLSRYLSPSLDLLGHFRISCGETQYGFETLHCLLARAWTDGRFELLSPGWDSLGYSRDALAGRGFGELISLEPKAARRAMKSLLAEEGPLEFGLRCNGRRELRYRWHRQFDDFTTSMLILGDELAVAGLAVTRTRRASTPRIASISA